MSEAGGVVLKGDDGTVYFIRDEILAACQLEGEYLEAAQPLINGEEPEVEGFALNVRQNSFSSIGSFGSPVGISPKGAGIASPKLDLGNVGIESTIMCPW